MSETDFIYISKIGQGTFGEVYKVKRISDNQVYAMKKVKILDQKDKDKKNTLNQIRILASIDHPNIIEYKEAFFDQRSSKICIIMELAPGGDLADTIKSKFKNGEEFFEFQIWKYGSNILSGLKHLHSLNIIHRDLKPANVFFGKNDLLKIGDLNVARKLNKDLAYTQTGTPNYASPEVWNNQPYSFQCDIWSFGCILYEMCCFKPPFRSKNMDQLYEKVQSLQYDSIPKRYSSLLSDIISKCLKDKGQRITLDQLINIFARYTPNQPLRKVISSINLIGTIEFPKNKNEFSNILPSPKYQQNEEPNPQNIRYEKRFPKQESILDLFLKDKSPHYFRMEKKTEKQKYEIRISQSQKVLQANNRIQFDLPAPILKEKDSFKHILMSLEAAKIPGIRPLERMNLRRRNLRMGLKY